MKILIIGSKGFIGKHCFDYFAKSGHHVHGCDVVSDYNQVNYHIIDASNSDFSAIFRKQCFDVCINCSGAASVPQSFVNPQRDYILNVLNVYKLLDAIKENNQQCKFINISSAAVYGNPNYLPIDEKHPLNPLSPYGSHKLQAENICKEFTQFWGIQTCSLRIFSAYGPGLEKQLFWDIAQKVINNKPFILFGTGNESRDFIYIDDILQAIAIIVNKADFKANIFNLASGKEYKINDIVSLFITILNSNIQYNFEGNIRTGDPLNWCADISIIQSLGFTTTTSIEKGLTKYCKWLEELK